MGNGWRDLSEADVKRHNARVSGRLSAVPKANKYHARKTMVDGVEFDSQHEATRYSDLKVMQQLGVISDLELQPAYVLYAHAPDNTGIEIGTFTADFRYQKRGEIVVEDAKSKATSTTAYRLRKRIVEACYGITVVEV